MAFWKYGDTRIVDGSVIAQSAMTLASRSTVCLQGICNRGKSVVICSSI